MTEQEDIKISVDVPVEKAEEAVDAVRTEQAQEAEAPQAEAAPQEEQVDLSAQFAELKRRERELRVNSKRAAESAESQKAEWMQSIKADPLAALAEMGIGADALADAILGVQAPAKEPELSEEYAEIKRRLDERDAAEQEAEQDRLVNEYKSEVFSVVEKDVEAYEILLNHPEGKDLYWDTILHFYQTNGEAPDDSELVAIAGRIEEHLYNKSKELLSLSKFAPKAPEVPVAAEQPAVEEKEFKTLSKNMTARSAPKVNLVEKANAYSAKTSYADYMDKRKAEMLAKFNNS